MTKPLTYADAGVDIDKASNFVNDIKEIAIAEQQSAQQ